MDPAILGALSPQPGILAPPPTRFWSERGGWGWLCCSHGILHHLEVAPRPPHCLHTIVQMSALRRLLASIRVGSSQSGGWGLGVEPEGWRGQPRKSGMSEHSTGDSQPWAWVGGTGAAGYTGAAAELCHAPPVSPHGQLSQACCSLSSSSISLSDTHALPLPLQPPHPSRATQPWNQIRPQRSETWATCFPLMPQPLPGTSPAPGHARLALRPPARPVAPFLGHIVGKGVRGAGGE